MTSSQKCPPLVINDLSDYPEHIPTLADWHQSEWSHFNPRRTVEDRIEKMHHHLTHAFIPTTWLAQVAGKPVGSVAIVESDMRDHPELSPWLASLYVDQAYRRQGIASALIANLIEKARQKEFDRLYLFTPDQQDFYARRGWHGLQQQHYSGSQVTIMSFDLGV